MMDQTIHIPTKSKIVIWLSMILSLLLPLWSILLVYLLYFTNYGILSILYFAWVIYDLKTPEIGGRRFEAPRKWSIFKLVAKYFPIELVKTAELDPSKNYIICVHPHGVVPVGAGINFSTEANNVGKLFPGIRFSVLTVPEQFYAPIHREIIINIFGAISCSKESLRRILSDPKGGKAPVLSVGGIREMFDARSNTYVIHLSRRKGFVRLALEQGAGLVPVFTFGENDIIDQLPNPEGSKLRQFQNLFLKLFGIPVVIPANLIPRSHRLITVVGAPLEFERVLDPTIDDVDRAHAKYVIALKQLFYENRDKYEESDRELTIV